MRRILRSHRLEDGASAVEYGLLLAGIAALIAAVVFLFGGAVKGLFSDTCQSIKTGGGSSVTIQGSCT